MESKNICPAHQKGEWAEEQVVRFLRRKNFRILKRRWRTPFAEVDLVAESPRQEIWLVEIKTLSHEDFVNVRVSRRQKERLQRAHLFVQSRTSKSVLLRLALVRGVGEIDFFAEF